MILQTGNFGLSDLPMVFKSKTRSVSAENPRGEKGGGATAEPDKNGPAFHLGKGWKARPCINLPGNSVTTLAELDGPGEIQHIWMTVDPKVYRECILRMYWDGEENPSVEVPLGDFFACGHSLRYNVNSIPVCVNPAGGLNCYWRMPFRKSCVITIENQRKDEIQGFFYQITYSLHEISENAAYFHAQWNRATTSRECPDYIILDNVIGSGHYVGTFLSWSQLSDGWWGEGEIKFYMDGDKEYPTICGTGAEDYFGGAWGFGMTWGFVDTYSTAYLGYPLYRKEPGSVPKHALYRWHVLDPIRFENDLKVTIQAIGWWPDNTFQPLADDIASVAYWYQIEPHNVFLPIMPLRDRYPR